MTDFSKITACGGCCEDCEHFKNEECSGCIATDGKCIHMWQGNNGACKVFSCCKNHGVSFCGLCKEFPCKWLEEWFNSWNKDGIANLAKLRSMMTSTFDITIKPLCPEHISDYLDFFDNRAFTDGNPNGPCYCTSPNQSEDEIKRMVSEFKDNGVKETVRKYAVKMLGQGKIHGYLAFDRDISIGWCNAADIDSYEGFIPTFARKNTCGKTVSIVCFEIAPEYRGKGIASALIDRVCADAKKAGYAAVEGYAQIKDQRDEFDFTGPVRLFDKAGFTEVARDDGQIIMRTML